MGMIKVYVRHCIKEHDGFQTWPLYDVITVDESVYYTVEHPIWLAYDRIVGSVVITSKEPE